jgi:hypothetical protein
MHAVPDSLWYLAPRLWHWPNDHGVKAIPWSRTGPSYFLVPQRFADSIQALMRRLEGCHVPTLVPRRAFSGPVQFNPSKMNAMSGTLVRGTRNRKVGMVTQDHHWTLFLVAGAAFMVVGWTDIALLWRPLLLDNMEWRFSTITASVNALPLPTLGLVLVGVAGLAKRRVGTIMAGGALAAILGAIILIAGALFASAAVVGRPLIEAEMMVLFTRAVTKTGILVAVYVLLHTWLAWTLFRSATRKETRV